MSSSEMPVDITEEKAHAILDRAAQRGSRASLRGIYRCHVALGMSRAAACEETLLTLIDVQRGGKGDADAARASLLPKP